MRKFSLKFGRYVSLLALIVLSAGLGVSAQNEYPVLLVDNSEKQELCNDPTLIAYPCFRTIQGAVGAASKSAVILVMPTGLPYAGFDLSKSGLRTLLIQGFRGLPTIQGDITIEGEFQVILQDLIVQGNPAISIGVSGSAPLFTRLQNLQVESKGTGVRMGQAGIVEILDSALCGGSCAQPGGASGCGIELGFSGQGITVLQGKQGLTAIWGFQDGICTKGAQQSRGLQLINTEVAFNAQHGLNLTGDPTRPENFFLMVQGGSKIQFNGRDGMRLENIQGFVWGNNIWGNSRHGVVLDGSGEVDISYNTISFNGDCGVLKLPGPMKVTGSGNEILSNGRDLCGDFPPDFRKP